MQTADDGGRQMKKIKFGIIGCGLMGKEFASAAGRWMHVNERVAQPEIVAVCDPNAEAMEWFRTRVGSVKYFFQDYTELLRCGEVEAVYCAVPHHLHKQVYVDIIDAKKHFLGEKPFGIDREANDAILAAAGRNPEVVVRCASEFPYYPAAQKLIRWIEEERFGTIIEVNAGLNHSSDLDLKKPINWKRRIETNGAYGCMGDLGIHTEHIPFRMGWKPLNVCAELQNIARERPDGNGNIVPCETWDNATLLCETQEKNGNIFPMKLEMKRMKPGATNDWYLEVHGLKGSARFGTDDPNAFYYTRQEGKEQAWCRIVLGNKPLYPTATGGIFEFGFADAILQMWVSFVREIEGETVRFGCFRPEETRMSHALHTAALESQEKKTIITIA